MGMSGGSSGSNQSSQGYSYNQSLAESMNAQSIWGPQAGALQGLYGQAGQLMQAQKGIGGTAQGQANAVMPAARAGLSSAQDIAATGGPIGQYAQPNNALARQQSTDLAQTVGQQFNREILPGIRSSSGLVGGIGGSRDALARGVAGGDAARAISQGSTDLYAAQYGIGANAANAATSARLSAAQGLPDMASGVYNLGMMPSQAQWAPLLSAASIFGGPTALSSGYSRAASAGESAQTSQGTSKSNQWGFNFF